MGIIGAFIIVIGVIAIIVNSVVTLKDSTDYLLNFISSVGIILLGYMFVLTNGILTAIKAIGG